MLNPKALLEEIKNGARKAFDCCRTDVKLDDIIGYALYSDDSAMTICNVVATTGGLQKYTYGSSDDFRFCPEEWDIQKGLEFLNPAMDMITADDAFDEDADPDEENSHEKFRILVYETCIKALEELKSEGFFHSDHFLIFWVTGSIEPKKKGIEWSKRLNNSKIHSEFEKWLLNTKYWG